MNQIPDTNWLNAESLPVADADDSFVRVGRIVAVTGAHAVILLDNDSSVPGDAAARSPEIGTLLKVDTPPSVALALVSALSAPAPSTTDSEEEMRIVEVEFIGELPKDDDGQPMFFRRGISCYPGLGDIVCRASKLELSMAYACDNDSSIRIGHIQQDSTIPAMVKIDEMLGKHFSVLGTTGTGKSCSVALILRRILEKNPKAHILLLDVHREYAASFKDLAEVVKPENMNLPFWLLNFDEIVEILIGQHASRETDIEVLRELIPIAKTRYMANQRNGARSSLRQSGGADGQNVGVDTPVPYRSSDLSGLLDEYIGKLEMKSGLAPYKRIKARLETVSRDPRFAFMFGSLTVQDTMADVIGRLFRVPVNGKPITILELGGLPSEVINVVVSVLARMAFDFGFFSGGQVPITFVCEEAHRYVPIDNTTGFEPTKRAISKIAKEGRKYGVSLCIVSQRPAELDPTILSQCNTIFSMRLSNEKDQEILKAGISDAAASLLEFMPTMGAGEAVTFGEGVALPTRIKFDLLPDAHLPKSSTASFTKNWATEIDDPEFLHKVVARWRHQAQDTIGEAPAEMADAAASTAQPHTQQVPQPQPQNPVQPQQVQPAIPQQPPVAVQPVQQTIPQQPQVGNQGQRGGQPTPAQLAAMQAEQVAAQQQQRLAGQPGSLLKKPLQVDGMTVGGQRAQAPAAQAQAQQQPQQQIQPQAPVQVQSAMPSPAPQQPAPASHQQLQPQPQAVTQAQPAPAQTQPQPQPQPAAPVKEGSPTQGLAALLKQFKG